MARNRFIVPGTVRHEISDGDWFITKEKLSYGETQTLAGGALGRPYESEDGGSAFGVDLKRYNVLRMMTWISAWSFCDAKGRQVPVSKSAIENLDPSTAAEINAALDAYIERSQAIADPVKADELIVQHQKAIAELEQAKNLPTPGTAGQDEIAS